MVVRRRTIEPTPEDKKVQQALKLSGEIPKHIAIIMDGNGRWAKERGMPRLAGHHAGVNSVRDVVEACGQLGVRYLTLYAFSTENWKRPKEEVSLLMRLLLKAIRDETDRLHQNNVRLTAIGEISALPQEVQDELLDANSKTKDNTGLNLILALSYSGRWDITNAVKKVVADVRQGKTKVDHIDEKSLERYLSTSTIPDPDLLIRTSGEFRISNFLLWQLAYTELVIVEQYWPDFRRAQLYAAIREYRKRERRFGMVSEQVKKKSGRGRYAARLLKIVNGS
ncbi:MAG: isoprenyl transferase [Bacteroidota bacterium]